MHTDHVLTIETGGRSFQIRADGGTATPSSWLLREFERGRDPSDDVGRQHRPRKPGPRDPHSAGRPTTRNGSRKQAPSTPMSKGAGVEVVHGNEWQRDERDVISHKTQ